MAKKKITEIAERELSFFLPENGYELYHIEFVKEAKDWFLRVYIDRADGKYVGTDDCEKVSRYLSERLDEEDPVPGSYYLEVSSPGLERALLKEKDFLRYMGNEVTLSLYKAQNGAKVFTGTLKGYTGGNIVISSGGTDIEFQKEHVSGVRLKIVF